MNAETGSTTPIQGGALPGTFKVRPTSLSDWAAAMALAGMPISSAFTLVHLPVPFWPAASSTASTKKRVGLAGSRCLRMSAVISIRYEPSSFWFHSPKTSESRSGYRAAAR